MSPCLLLRTATKLYSLSPRHDAGVFNTFLTYFGSETSAQRSQTAEEQHALDLSKQVIEECDLDAVIDDTKFLRTSSLQV